MQNHLRILVSQMNSTDDVETNIDHLHRLEPYMGECDLLALPEMAPFMSSGEHAFDIQDADPKKFITACRNLACKFGIWIQPGSMASRESGKWANRSLLIDSSGCIVATYDKIHLFDANPPGHPRVCESSRFSPGQHAVAAETPWGLWGLTICYDVRFPQLYRACAQAGTRLIFVPSAFTVPTGRAHWATLLRARAIENGCWIVAAAQVGTHSGSRTTFGHSMVVDPWGDVILDLGGSGSCQAVVDIDLSASDRRREQIPSLQHDRNFDLIVAG